MVSLFISSTSADSGRADDLGAEPGAVGGGTKFLGFQMLPLLGNLFWVEASRWNVSEYVPLKVRADLFLKHLCARSPCSKKSDVQVVPAKSLRSSPFDRHVLFRLFNHMGMCQISGSSPLICPRGLHKSLIQLFMSVVQGLWIMRTITLVGSG